jgi:hypothetical protein
MRTTSYIYYNEQCLRGGHVIGEFDPASSDELSADLSNMTPDDALYYTRAYEAANPIREHSLRFLARAGRNVLEYADCWHEWPDYAPICAMVEMINRVADDE